jgi:hypothetical protein
MALEDFTDPEVAVVAVVAAAVFSPKVRGWLRRGAVYGTAGAISSVARGVGQSVQQAGTAAANSAQNAMHQAKNNATQQKSESDANTSKEGWGETFS